MPAKTQAESPFHHETLGSIAVAVARMLQTLGATGGYLIVRDEGGVRYGCTIGPMLVPASERKAVDLAIARALGWTKPRRPRVKKMIDKGISARKAIAMGKHDSTYSRGAAKRKKGTRKGGGRKGY